MVYLMVEQQFAKYPWCQRTIRGIFEEVRSAASMFRRSASFPVGRRSAPACFW